MPVGMNTSTMQEAVISRSYRDGAVVPEMVIVPPGTFQMGATDADDKFASMLEKPRHVVTIDHAFSVGRYPITFDEWDAYAAEVPRAHRPDDRGWGRGRLPVHGVSWDDAAGYIASLRERTGRPYRLLSEAEWEYCCRAGSMGAFATGPSISVHQANFFYHDFGGEKPGLGRPTPVGSYPPNAFGLHDFHGNVCEWTADAWHDDYAGAPNDGSAWTARDDLPYRVVRGGGWDAMPRILRCAFRDWARRDSRTDNTGFRVACSL